MTETAYLGLGSNIDAARHVQAGLDELDALVGLRRISNVYLSDAIGFEGDPFLNLVVEVQTALAPGSLHAALREIEYRYGRMPDATKNSSRHLDIDILTLGDRCGLVDGVELPRGEIFENAFVLAPFAELAPDAVLPGQSRSLSELWERACAGNFGQAVSRQIRKIEFSWRGRALPQLSVPVATAQG